MNTLAVYRKHIDALDEKIIRLLNRRAGVVQRIGQMKRRAGGAVYVPERETMVLRHLRRANTGPLGNQALMAIYREVMSAALALEKPLVVAYFGPASTFTHQAARSRFGSSVDYLACETIGDVFDVVAKGQADYGVVPIENTTEGAVTNTLDQFVDTPLKICAEIYLKISLNLMAKGVRRDIRKILSIPIVFDQCRKWLRAELPGVELVPVTSTARAAEMASRDRQAAAIAGALAAELYHLKILDSDIQDLSGNTTRFLVISRACGKATGNDKTSIVFSVKHRAGALHDALASLKKYRLNMTKIESRPSKLKAWEYVFFVDIEGHTEEKRVRKALQDLSKHCTMLTILGAYPKAPEGLE